MLQSYKRIMVAVDGSSESELAFQKAMNVALRNQATLLLVHVIDTRAFQSVSAFDGTMAEQATELAKQTLAIYKKEAEEQGCTNITTLIEYGAPKPLIAQQLPQTHHVDLILLGATGLNAIERLLIGSVSEYVIRNASCDVLVVRTNLDNQLPAVTES